MENQELQAKQQDLVEHQEGIRCLGIQVVPSLVNQTNRVIIDLNIYICSKQWPLELTEIVIGCINIIHSRGINTISQH